MRTIFIVLCAIIIAGFYGWVQNIITIVHAGPVADWGGMIIVRAIGVVVAPLGAVLGFF